MKGTVKSNSDPILEIGEQAFEIEDKIDGKTQKGDPKVTLKLIGLDGPNQGRRIRHTVIFFPEGNSAEWIAKAFMSAIGVERNPETGEFEYDTDNWPGRKFKATVEHGEYQGQKQNNLRKIAAYHGEGAPF